MTTKIRVILIGIVVAIILGTGGYLGFEANKYMNMNKQLNEELQIANLAIGKAHTQLGDANKKLSELDQALQKEIKSHKELISRYDKLYALYKNQGGGTATSDGSNQPPVVSKLQLDTGFLYLAQDKETVLAYKLPLRYNFEDYHLKAITILSSMTTKDHPFELSTETQYVMTLRLVLKMAETVGPTGAVNHYAELWELDANNKEVNKLEITKYESIVTDQRSPHFTWWNPHVDVGVFGGWTGKLDYGGTVGLSLMGYGLTDNDLSWRFIHLGIQLGQNGVALDFAPALWNVGGPIPLISNLWVAPTLSYKPGVLGAGLTFNVVL